MMNRTTGIVGVLLWVLMGVSAYAQEAKSFQLVLPDMAQWSRVPEGTHIQFTVGSTSTDSVRYSLLGDNLPATATIDSLGHFSWHTGYDAVSRIEGSKLIPITFEATNKRGQRATHTVDFTLVHVNRPPTVGQLKPFYVSYRTQNVYKIDADVVHDDDGDPLVFIPILDQMPEGSKMTSQGELTWTLSQQQFNRLKNEPLFLEFWVEDQPAKTRTKGRLKIEVTQMDLPPDLAMVPKETRYRIREDATLPLKFYLSDPNGDDDLATFQFLSDNPDVPKSALIKNTPTQYEFIWKPGYAFVKDPKDTLAVHLTFFALDKAQNRAEQRITVVVQNAVNEAEKDKYLYTQYRQVLVQAWGLIEQLAEKEEQLKRDYKRAKGGKRNRSVVNASLGAVTGVSPAITNGNQATQKAISAVGGTAVMTMGTLEATEVIGKSMKDLLDRYNYVMSKKADLQNKGDIFAREFALKSSRRGNDFVKKLDEFRAAMSLSGLVALELDANWQNKKEANDKALKRQFKDFALPNEDE